MMEVYEPGSIEDCICSFSSETVFPTISTGETLNLTYLGQEVRAKEISHIIWENGNCVSFKTMIFTESISSKMHSLNYDCSINL